MKKLNNKGFTLVELVAAMGILGMIALAVSTLMTAGTNMYSGVQKRSNILYKSQVAALQMEEYLVNVGSDDGIAIDGNTLYIVDKSEEKLTVFQLDPAEDKDTLNLLEYGVTVPENLTDSPSYGVEALTENIPFSNNIAGVEYSPFYESSGGKNFAYAIRFNLTITKNGLTYDKNSLVYLKNKPVFVSGDNAVDELLELVF